MLYMMLSLLYLKPVFLSFMLLVAYWGPMPWESIGRRGCQNIKYFYWYFSCTPTSCGIAASRTCSSTSIRSEFHQKCSCKKWTGSEFCCWGIRLSFCVVTWRNFSCHIFSYIYISMGSFIFKLSKTMGLELPDWEPSQIYSAIL